MARLLLVLKPRGQAAAVDLIPQILPALAALGTEIDNRGPAHLSALMRVPPQGLAVQVFADVQPQADGPELDVVLMSSEAMTRGAPQTLQALQSLIELLPELVPGLELIFRSDRDGPLPSKLRDPAPAQG